MWFGSLLSNLSFKGGFWFSTWIDDGVLSLDL